MTTRQSLNSRFYRGSLLMIAATLVLGVWRATSLASAMTDTTVRVLGVASFAGMLVYLWQTPCVACDKPLGWTALMWRPAAAPFTSPKCSLCGTSFDKPAGVP